jgi:hypothetical protein
MSSRSDEEQLKWALENQRVIYSFMAKYTITLSEQTYQHLLAIAQEKGITPEHWIHSQLPTPSDELKPLSTLLTGFIGAIDSKAEPVQPPTKTAFGEAIAAKLARQGIHRP